MLSSKMQFNTSEIILEALENQGYTRSEDIVNNTCGLGEYAVNYRAGKSWFRLRSHNDNLNVCVIRIEKEKIHFHGSKIGCRYINLANPGSLVALNTTIASISESDDSHKITPRSE